jgi:hypothetical protein
MQEKRYINEREVAAITGLALSTLRNHRFQRIGIPHYKIGRAVRYDYEQVIKFMEAHAIQTEHR